MKIIKAADYNDMSRKAANIIFSQVSLFPGCILGLATGSTPLGTYKELVAKYISGDADFSCVRSFNLDEYCGMRPDNPQSYHYYMHENLFRHINIKPENVHVPDGFTKEEDCRKYDEMIASFGGIDLQLLGLGKTGHIGFNEPAGSFPKYTHKVALKEQTIKDNSRFFSSIDDVPKFAVTMGLMSIMQSKRVLMVVNGIGKAETLKRALFGPVTPQVPASILQLHPNFTVVADKDALSKICG
ncbi:MAG TPA: glucosamine-6-phosphate deaminase [Ruminococcaceae bacterium]|nr:glucosamine-6-phosphate deaminase [Oscillospiraceae bacterium]